jgi:hypothetical protein
MLSLRVWLSPFARWQARSASRSNAGLQKCRKSVFGSDQKRELRQIERRTRARRSIAFGGRPDILNNAHDSSDRICQNGRRTSVKSARH